MVATSSHLSQSEQAKQLLSMLAMIRSTCPQDLQSQVLPLLDQLEADQQKLDEILQTMAQSPLVGTSTEDVEALAETNRQRYEEHTALAAQMQQALGKVLALVK